MNILIAEDDVETAAFLVRGLTELHHRIQHVETGTDALDRLKSGDFDIVVMDRMLPGLDGLSVIRQVRQEGISTPALMLTALGRIEDRVDGLEAGADDYLVKPFAFSELTARLNALARRGAGLSEDTVLRVGPIELNLLKREVRRGGVRIEVQPREFALLEELMRAGGRIVTRTMLLERVWNFHFDPKTNIVETHISRLRGKLNAGHEGDVIHTVRGAGYMMAADA